MSASSSSCPARFWSGCVVNRKGQMGDRKLAERYRRTLIAGRIALSEVIKAEIVTAAPYPDRGLKGQRMLRPYVEEVVRAAERIMTRMEVTQRDLPLDTAGFFASPKQRRGAVMTATHSDGNGR